MYLKNKQIDTVKWDKCITNAYNGNVFGYSWYLSMTCQYWDALVYEDYKAVFPLPIDRKFGLSYIYHPHLCGQLGIFSIEKLDNRLIHLFLERIPHSYKKINIRLNKFINISTCDYAIKEHITYVIDLIKNSTNIYSQYSKDLRINIDKALQGNMTVMNALRPNEVLEFLQNENTLINKPLKPHDFDALRKILAFIINKNMGSIYATYSPVNNICALSIILFSHNKISIPIIGVNKEGIKNKAVELMAHSIIFNNIEKNITLSYEQTEEMYFSEIFANFGAEHKKFKEIHKHSLIWPFNKFLIP